MLRNLLVVLKLLGFSKAPPTTSALELLTAARVPESVGAGAAPPATQGAYVRREADYAWECMQKEAQHLLNELLQPSAVQPGLRTDYQNGEDTPAWRKELLLAQLAHRHQDICSRDK